MTLWTEARARAGLEPVLAEVRAAQPHLHENTWTRGNDRYPLQSRTSLNVTGPPWDETVVLAAEIMAHEAV